MTPKMQLQWKSMGHHIERNVKIHSRESIDRRLKCYGLVSETGIRLKQDLALVKSGQLSIFYILMKIS